MARIIDENLLRFGDAVQTYRAGIMSWVVCAVIGGEYSHDAKFIYRSGRWWIGHEKGWRGVLQSVDDFNAEVRSGKMKRYRVINFPQITERGFKRANDWWVKTVLGAFYDYAGAIKAGLLDASGWAQVVLKGLLGWSSDKIRQWEFAWYCTENLRGWVQIASGGLIDPWGSENPTPRTTSKRVEAGLIADVTDERTTVKFG